MNLGNLSKFISRNSPKILTVLSLAGVISTVVTASKDTARAKDVITVTRPRNRKEVLRATWKCYIPTAISAGTTMACIIGSHYCSNKQKEALSSAYALSQLTLHKYQEKVIERLGNKKAEAVREEVMNEVAEIQSPAIGLCNNLTKPIDTGKGTTLFYDIPAKTWFYSDKNFLDAQTNEMNRDVRTEMYYDWNEIRYRWGLPFLPSQEAENWVFTCDDYFEPKFQAMIMDNGQVRVNINYELVQWADYIRRNK